MVEKRECLFTDEYGVEWRFEYIATGSYRRAKDIGEHGVDLGKAPVIEVIRTTVRNPSLVDTEIVYPGDDAVRAACEAYDFENYGDGE